MQLRVKSLRYTHLITVQEEARLSAVKTQLPVAEWTNKQFLHHGLIVAETVPLSSFGVQEGSELLIVSIRSGVDRRVVFLNHEHFRYCHFCSDTTTIAQLRQVCSQKLPTDLDSLHLYFNKELLADSLLVDTLGYKPDIEVVISKKQRKFTSGSYQMFIKELTGKTHSLDVYYSTTISEIKELLGEREGLPPFTLTIVFAGKQLSDESTLSSIGAGRKSTFHMIRRLR